MDSLELSIRQLEERLINPQARKSEKELNDLLADEFTEFGSSGQIYNKQQTLLALRKESEFTAQLTDFKIIVLTRDVVLAKYRAAIILNNEEAKTIYSLRSSIWKRDGQRWQIVFHQGTPENLSAGIPAIA